MSKEEVVKKLTEILSRNIAVPAEDISKDTKLSDKSFDMDSIDFVEFISDVDVEFDTKLMDLENSKLETIDMISEQIVSHRNERA